MAALLVTQGLTAALTAADTVTPARYAAPVRVTQSNLAARNQPAIRCAAQEDIRMLSPTQSLPVEPSGNVTFQELPFAPLLFDPMPGDMQPAEGVTHEPLQGATSATDAQPAFLTVECANVFPDIKPVAQQHPYVFGRKTPDPPTSAPVGVATRGSATTHPWFSAVGSQQGFSYSGGGGTYRDTAGPTVALGNLTPNAPIWGSTVPIRGLQLSSGWSGPTKVLSEGTLAYSSSVGWLNYADTVASGSAIDYGVTAGSGSLRYGLTSALTLESQIQSSPDMTIQGLGTTYAAGKLGTFRLGATKSDFDQINAWRYRFGYNVNLSKSISLAVTNEQIDAGFGDLSVYRSGTISAPLMRNTFAAGVPLRGGTLTGTYTGTRESGIAVEQRIGLEHSKLVAPDVRLSVGADRDVVTGDYEMRAGITMPVDAFMRRRWPPR